MIEFPQEVAQRIAEAAQNSELQGAARQFLLSSISAKYSYNYSWLGRPIIQYPQDMVAVQELIWETRPDLIIETGIAHGGSLILSASMLALLDLCDAIESGQTMDPRISRRRVFGLDIDIRPHNREAIEAHPMSSRIQMFQGSSVAPDVVAAVKAAAVGFERVMVMLDSNHCHGHVLEELKAYAPLVTRGSYCVVFDTVVEDLPKELAFDRPWGPGDSPKTAVSEFLRMEQGFVIDRSIQDKLLITVAPDGFLRRVE